MTKTVHKTLPGVVGVTGVVGSKAWWDSWGPGVVGVQWVRVVEVNRMGMVGVKGMVGSRELWGQGVVVFQGWWG